MTNLNTAFDVAEKYLDIPKMLDAEGELMRRETVVPLLICQTFILKLKFQKDRRLSSSQTCRIKRSFYRIDVVIASCCLH